ncbi:MAG: PRC-barrel domain-containing protein [Jannaschia sp.]
MAFHDTGAKSVTRGVSSMISSSDVNGTTVYGADGGEVGHIDHLMIDKTSGRVAYAVMHFGGFLGLGEETHPVPWGTLSYDTKKSGYVTEITREQLEGAPRRGENWPDDRQYREDMFKYYSAAPYWM